MDLQNLTALRFSGELAALASAIVWAVAPVLFKQIGRIIRPAEMNLLKGLLAMLMLVITIVLAREPIPTLEWWVVVFLLVSGAWDWAGRYSLFHRLELLGYAARFAVDDACAPDDRSARAAFPGRTAGGFGLGGCCDDGCRSGPGNHLRFGRGNDLGD